jgi:hypothetical protein
MAGVPKWHLDGDGFDVCKCNIPCPCTFAQMPTFGDCDGILVWHVRKGTYGDDFAPIEFDVAGDLGTWRAAIPGRVEAKSEALTGPTTLPGQRVQMLNPPGSEVGPGGVATWGTPTVDRADAFGFNLRRSGQSSKHIPFAWSGPG